LLRIKSKWQKLDLEDPKNLTDPSLHEQDYILTIP